MPRDIEEAVVPTYPGGIPDLKTEAQIEPGTSFDPVLGIPQLFGEVNGEVEAVTAELGTNPSGSEATVKARLDALDTTVAGKAASSHTHSASTLGALSDVTIGTPSTGQVLKWNGTAWINDTDATGSGGGGAVDSVNGETGVVVLDAADVGAATSAQGSLADSAVQPGDLATVATTGDYDDLSNKPTIPGAETLPATIIDAKGDLVVGTAADTAARLPVGATTGHVLTVDPAEAAGMKWAAAGGGGGYASVVTVRGARIFTRTSSGTTKTLGLPSGHGILAGDSITVVGSGGVGYDGTFTVTSTAGQTNITYTGGASSAETGVAATGHVIGRRTLPARTTLAITSPAHEVSDEGGAETQLLVANPQFPVPAVGQSVWPLTVGASFADSYNVYQGEKACPIYIAKAGMTFNNIQARINASSAAGVVRFGIRAMANLGMAGNLVSDLGTTNIIGFGTQTHSRAISWTAEVPGWYWLTISFQVSSAGAPAAIEGTMLPTANVFGDFGGFVAPEAGAGTTTGALGVPGISASMGAHPGRVPLISITRSA
jgi:hypothetical protein